MPFYSKMRVPQLTGSYGLTSGKINDQGAAIATGSISSAGLDEILGHLASSIKRIHGGDSFSETLAGVFEQQIVVSGNVLPGSDNSHDLGGSTQAWKDLYLEGNMFFSDAAEIDVAAGDLVVDVAGDITLDADGDQISLKFGGAAGQIDFSQANTGDGIIRQMVDVKDLVIQQFDGNEVARFTDDRKLKLFDDGDEYLSSDGTDLTLGAGADINLTAATDINIPANVGLKFGDDGEGIEGNGTKLTIASSDDLDLTVTDVVLTAQTTKIEWGGSGSGEHIVGAGTNELTIAAGADINLTAASGDVNIPSDIGLTFGNDGEKIEGDGTDLSIASSNNLSVVAANKMTIDAQGTDSGDGVEITLGADDANVKFIVQNNSAADALVVDGLLDVTVGRNLTVVGNLDVNGTTTTVDTTNLTIEDSIIALGVSGSGGYSASGDRGIIFPRGAAGSKTAGFYFDGSDFNLGMSLTGPTSGSFASIAAAEYSSLKAGALKAGADSSYDLGESNAAYRKLYVDAIDLNGQGDISLGGTGRIDFDADDDTSIRASADDVMVFEAGAADVMTLTVNGLQIEDDKGLVFGSNQDAIIQYDENGNDVVEITGAAWRFADDQIVGFGNAGDVTFEYDEDGDDVLQIASANGHVRIGHGADTQLQFRDSAVYINSDTDGHLQARADSQISLNINGTDELVLIGSTATFGTNLRIPDAGLIGNASVADVIALAADGVVTFKDDLVTKDGGTFGNATNADLLTLAAAAVTVKSNSDFNVAKTAGLQLGGVAVSSTAAEINLLDGDTSTGVSIAIADADGIFVNDAGTSKLQPMSDVVTYIQKELTQKQQVLITGLTSAGDDVDLGFSADADWTNALEQQKELYLNGQLLCFGADASANKDYYPGGSAGRVKFEFDLAQGDVIQAILRAG
jgi:hypothetical protein